MYTSVDEPLDESLQETVQAFFQLVDVFTTSMIPFDQHQLLSQIAIHTQQLFTPKNREQERI